LSFSFLHSKALAVLGYWQLPFASAEYAAIFPWFTKEASVVAVDVVVVVSQHRLQYRKGNYSQ